MQVTAMKCDKCGQLHQVESKTYIQVFGNIVLGENGGMVGNNLDADGKVTDPSCFCYPRCFAQVVELDNPVNRNGPISQAYREFAEQNHGPILG